ncbi:hypothetical protein J007_00983 [Cryptococcus neoformans]|nr:hypothetical protein J007_00983 [Cryptococcus neoformans var. grubii]
MGTGGYLSLTCWVSGGFL